jgi:hypothetical protein
MRWRKGVTMVILLNGNSGLIALGHYRQTQSKRTTIVTSRLRENDRRKERTLKSNQN